MPSGKVHFQDSLVTVGVTAALATITGADAHSSVLILSGMVVPTFLTPDTDLGGPIYGNYVLRHVKPLDLALRGYSYIYGKMSAHRGLSHVMGVGTVLRISLLSPVIIPVLWALREYAGIDARPDLKSFMIWMLGWLIIDAVHIIHDEVVSANKVKSKKGLKYA